MTDLVRSSGAAPRTLRKHFKDFLGMSPLGYLRRMRLATLRDELLSPTAHRSITELAVRYGFHHLGRFSAEYRRCFGEHPSTTVWRARAAGPHRPCKQEDTVIGLDPPPEISRTLQVRRERPSLVMLPFRTATADERFFGDSLAESIACTLCRARSLAVTAASSSSGGAPVEPQRLARDCGARYALTGRIARAGDRLRVIICLLDVTSGLQLWGDSYDGRADNPFRLQDRVTEGIMRAIIPNVRRAEIERAQRKRSEDLNAYDLTMRALPLVFAANSGAAKQALDLLGRAMEVDVDFALPVAMAAWCHAQLLAYNGTHTVAEEKAHALRLAKRANALDANDDPLVITARCAVHTILHDLETAAMLVERALALDPNSSWVWERSGWLNTYMGQSGLAVQHFKHAIRLAPAHERNAIRCIGVGSAYFDLGDYQEAARWKRKALLEEPDTAWVNRTLAVTYARLGDRLTALNSLDAFRRCCPDVTIKQVISAAPFRPDFWSRVAEGLDDLGLPP